MSIDGELVRETSILFITDCLHAQLTQGTRVATYRIDRIVQGVNLIVNCDLSHLSGRVERRLNELGAPTTYKVTLNTLNGICHFTARTRSA